MIQITPECPAGVDPLMRGVTAEDGSIKKDATPGMKGWRLGIY